MKDFDLSHYGLGGAFGLLVLQQAGITPDCFHSVWATGATALTLVAAWIGHNKATDRQLLSGAVK